MRPSPDPPPPPQVPYIPLDLPHRTRHESFNTLQHTVTQCNPPLHTTTHCNILQHTTTRCNTLHHTELRSPLLHASYKSTRTRTKSSTFRDCKRILPLLSLFTCPLTLHHTHALLCASLSHIQASSLGLHLLGTHTRTHTYAHTFTHKHPRLHTRTHTHAYTTHTQTYSLSPFPSLTHLQTHSPCLSLLRALSL